MPRYYAKTESSVDFANVADAIKKIKIDKNSIRTVAAADKIPKSNLARYIKKIDEANIDVSTATNDELIEFLKVCVKHGAKTVSFN